MKYAYTKFLVIPTLLVCFPIALFASEKTGPASVDGKELFTTSWR